MVELHFPKQTVAHISATDELLTSEEVVAVVDDSPEIVLLLCQYLHNRGYRAVSAGNVHGLYQMAK